MQLSELVDIDDLSGLCESFTAQSGAVTAILDLEGNILVATGWQDICTCFHRIHPLTAQRCRESDTILAGKLHSGEKYNVYKCKNGLVDVAVPLVIEGEHIANFFTGQFFFEPPDMDYFVRQAEEFGFEKESYLEALKRVPLFSEHQIQGLMKFFSHLTQLFGKMGLAQKRLNESLFQIQENQQRLNFHVDNSPLASIEWDSDFIVTRWAGEAEKIFGWTQQETLGKPIMDLQIIYEEDLPIVQNTMSQLVDGSSRYVVVTNRNYTKERKLIICEWYNTVLRNSQGQMISVLSQVLDITERKRAEESLKTTADFLEESQRIGKMGSYEYDILSSNWTSTATLDEIFGITANYVKDTEGWLAIIAPEQREQMQEYLSQHVITGKQSFDKEYMIRRISDGALRWVHGRGKLHFDTASTPVRMIGSIRDITERRLAEEELRYKFAELDAIYTHAPMMMCLVDSDRRILYANPAFRSIQGTSEEELIGGHACGVFGCVNAKDDPQGCGHDVQCRDCTLLKAIEETFQTGTGHLNEEHHIVVNGEDQQREYTYLGSTALIYSGDQRHLLLTLIDISEQKKAEEDKKTLEQQLQQAQKLESLGVLAGGIAHDFNNILAIIVGNCFLAKMHPEKDESYITTIEKASERAAELCRQMLAYAGKSQFIEEHINMGQLVDEMVKMLKATIPQNVVINLFCSADIPYLKADASQLRQIVMNLITNAAEAIGEAKGEVLITLTKTTITKGPAITDHLGKPIPPGSYICLEVTEDGCGMDEETIRRIFEPFYTTKFFGRGLGMSATLGILSAHKGALQLFSQPGLGTTFKIYLPIDNHVLTGNNTPEGPATVAWQGSGTILLVEDEEQIKMIVAAMLTSLGFSVLDASNGKEALELYREYATDITLVLTDIGMPVMDGYELFNELKKLDPALPIIISSGFGENVITSRIASADIAALITKPYKFDLLSNVLKSVMEDIVPNGSPKIGQ